MKTSQQLVIKAKDGGSFDCYVSQPEKRPAPAIVIIQEIFGITNWLKSVADWLASQGYFAVVPDLFWRLEPGIVLDDRDQTQLQKAFGLYGKFNQSQGISDLTDTVSQVRTLQEVNGKVGCTGFCLGGLMTYLMAACSDVDCSVSYYGGGINEKLDEIKNIKKPLLLHIAEQDQYIGPAAQNQIRSAIANNPLITMHVYPDVDHAFARVGGQNYNKAAGDLANSRTSDFFKKYLL